MHVINLIIIFQGSQVTHTFQALSDYERKHWVEAMGGTWSSMSTLQRMKADSVEDNLNSMAFTFLKDCLNELEARGLNDQGLYRVGGVISKVKKLLAEGLDPASTLTKAGRIDLSDPKQWESKTIASAVKQYFRDLSKPLMTHQLYQPFLEAVKHESEQKRVSEIGRVVVKMPPAGREMLRVLIRHLHKVAANAKVNLMTPSNLGVIFGPNLLRPKEETVASIMDIKFCNEVVEILIEHCDTFFPAEVGTPEIQSGACRKYSSSAVEDDEDEVDLPDRGVRGSSTPVRANSIGSFSQMSTNSLPDIKEFNDRPSVAEAMTTSSVERPRSRSHQLHLTRSRPDVHRHVNQISLPPKLMKSSTQDDLMASLEMMNSLAADLPTSPLKRSLTLQPVTKCSSRSGPGQKPPLPKLSVSSSNSDYGSTSLAHGLNTNNNMTSTFRHNSSPSPSLSSHSNQSVDSGSASASPRSLHKSSNDFLTRMQQQVSDL